MTLADPDRRPPSAMDPFNPSIMTLAPFTVPDFVDKSAWLQHAPFAFWVTEQAEPTTIVELGTHGGFSYFSFCQAVDMLQLDTRCYAVDTWQGDEHAGFYGPEVFRRVQRYNDEHYSTFSRLLRMTFNDALQYFIDGSVDLLHIDGRHRYEDVKEDFESWEAKLSPRAIVLFHDINVREKGFGVYKYWSEIEARYPSFSFLHGHGLGVIAVGDDYPIGLRPLFEAPSDYPLRLAFSRLGSLIQERQERTATEDLLMHERRDAARLRELLDTTQTKLAMLDQEALGLRDRAKNSDTEIAILNDQATTLKAQLAEARSHAEELSANLENERRHSRSISSQARARQRSLEHRIRTVERSTSWRVTRPMRFLSHHLRLLRPRRTDYATLARWMVTLDLKSLRNAVRQRILAGSVTPTPSIAHSSGAKTDAHAEVGRLRRAGDLVAADAAASRLIAQNDAPTALLLEAGELAMVRRRWADASARFEAAMADPRIAQSPERLARFAAALRRNGELARAEAVCDEGLTAAPGHEGLIRERAEVSMTRGHWSEAAARWSEMQCQELSGGLTAIATAGTAVSQRAQSAQRTRREVTEYREARSRRLTGKLRGPRIAIVTAITGGYDPLHVPPVLDEQADYIVYTDRALPHLGVFDVRPLPYHSEDPTRGARYVKTHLHDLLADYDVAVWVDSNVLPLRSWQQFVHDFLHSGRPLGAIRHPLRDSVTAESDACIHQGRDRADVIRSQVARYLSTGVLDNHDLIESNFLIVDLNDPLTRQMFVTWWSEIDKGSRRDQISLSYSLAQHKLPWHPLMNYPTSLRDHAEVAWIEHGSWREAAMAIGDHLAAMEPPEPHRGRRQRPPLSDFESTTVDIIVCVHNALTDVKECLEAVRSTRRPDVHRIILVDDGSDSPTAEYLRRWVEVNHNVSLLRNSVATGYTRAANLGLKASTADMVVLLNSDTIVTSRWLEKMARAVLSTPGAGVVGPLSNAASHQSVPNHQSSANQTAVNALPIGHSAEDINALYERWSVDAHYPRVPLIHGFCLGITRSALETVGMFDATAFPHGYGEENDFCLRASDAGFGLVVAIDTYIFHKKSKSYPQSRRVALMRDGSETLRRLHGRERVKRAVQSMQANPSLAQARRKARSVYARPFPSERLNVTAVVQSTAGYPTSSAYVRLLGPARRLQDEAKISFSVSDDICSDEVARSDLVIIQRTAVASVADADAFVARLAENRSRFVLDIDDALLLIEPKDEHGQRYADRHTIMERLLAQADAAWFSTPLVAHMYSHNGQYQEVLPNTLDLDLWQPISPVIGSKRPPGQHLQFLFMGTFTHRDGLELLLPALDRVHAAGHEFELNVVGIAADVPSRPWMRNIPIPGGLNRYPDFVSWLRQQGPFDVGLAPLRDDPFNRAKSDLKFLDYTALGLLTVASDVAPFHGPHADAGRLVLVENSTEAWEQTLGEVVVRTEAYASVAGRACAYLRTERSHAQAAGALLRAICTVGEI
jgi:GT2 family glycosyltransferase/glycosyltransferase involved in cell wall biosynthesis